MANSEQQRSKAAERQKRYRDRLKARNTEDAMVLNSLAQSVTRDVTVTEDVTPPAAVTESITTVTPDGRDEDDDMLEDDTAFVPIPMTPEQEAANDVAIAELDATGFPKPYELWYSDAIPEEAWRLCSRR